MNEEEQKFIQEQQKEIEKARTLAEQSQVNAVQQAVAIQEQEKSLMKEQLDLSEELITMKHLLHGHILKEEPNGEIRWQESKIPEMEVLSDYGVYLIMDAIISHTTKNSLLTNLDEDKISRTMINFGEDLNDTVFMQSEKVFKYPTFEECKEEFQNRLDKNIELRTFAMELAGQKADEKVVRKEFLDKIENRVDYEMNKIREYLMKNKYKRYLLLIRNVLDFVEHSLNRAWKGEERKTLRQHTHISETINPNPIQMPRPSKLNPLNWGRR